MSNEDLLAVVGIPPSFRDLIGEYHLEKLSHAHPRVRVERTYETGRFTELVLEADAAIIQADFRFPPEVLKPESRLRWIQLTAVGANRVLTPELIVAEHVTITGSKGPLGPLMAEHAVTLMLALARDIPGYLKSQANRFWSRHMEWCLFQ